MMHGLHYLFVLFLLVTITTEKTVVFSLYSTSFTGPTVQVNIFCILRD